MPVTATPIDAGAATGRYASQCDVESQFGIDNVRVWSQLDNTETAADISRIQAALNYADARIATIFQEFGNYAAPLSPIGDGIALVRRWAAIIAGAWLYQSRGMRDDDPQGDHVARLAAQIETEMGRYRSAEKLPAARRWPTATGPVAC